MDTDYYGECGFAGALAEVPEIRRDIRDATPADLEGIDAVVHLAALSNDPLGNLDPELTYDINDARLDPLRPARQGGRRRALPLLVVVQHLRRGRRRLPGRDRRRSIPVTPYGVSKVRAGAAARRAGGRPLQPRPTCATPRPTASPPACGWTSCSTTWWARRSPRASILIYERRHAVAADRPHRGHLPRLPRRAGAPREAVHDQAFNVGRDGRELPHPRAGRDRGRDRPGCAITSPTTPARTSATTGWTPARSRQASRASRRPGLPATALENSTKPSRRRASPSMTSRAGATAA